MKHSPRSFIVVIAAGIVLIVAGVALRSQPGVPSGAGSGRAVYQDQDRNGPCWDDAGCKEGLTCEGATRDAPGVCSFVCRSDADCGNGFLCRDRGCQADCAGQNEKCSDRRVCCFFDADGDSKNDVSCTEDAEGDRRCLVE